VRVSLVGGGAGALGAGVGTGGNTWSGGGGAGIQALMIWGVVSVFRAVASHVALGAAPEAPSFSSILGSFLVSKLLKRHSYICSVNIHRDVFIVSISALTSILVRVVVT
jgi:hypothetical protein